MTRRCSNRRGYALLLVMIFVVLFTAILGVAWRRVASALRIEHVSEVRKQCDEGSVKVLAQAMTVLETRVRWNSTSRAMLDGSGFAEVEFKKQDANGQWYRITFTRVTNPVAWSEPVEWSVSVSRAATEPFDISQPLPNSPP
jgi:hypothetical protein